VLGVRLTVKSFPPDRENDPVLVWLTVKSFPLDRENHPVLGVWLTVAVSA
jgi:hypothetical protein